MALVAAIFVPSNSFHLVRAAFGPLAYWIFLSSIAGYSILTGATKVLSSFDLLRVDSRSSRFATVAAWSPNCSKQF
jgi:hypothetical protein